MNYMKQVAEMLGIELDEEFYLKGSKYKHKLTKDGLFYCLEDGKSWLFANWTFYEVLAGELEIIKKPILDEIERRYLSEIIKPFRKQVISIGKLDSGEYECIVIKYRNINGYTNTMCFPYFEKGTIYKGMETEKRYSLSELEL